MGLVAGHALPTRCATADQPIVRVAADVFAKDRIDLSGAQPAAEPAAQPAAQQRGRSAAPGPADNSVQQVGYFDGGIGRDSRIFESTCGCETVCDCSVGEVYGDPGCGIEASCGLEAFPGGQALIEPGCGCGAVGCDSVGCDGCCDGSDPSCGCGRCQRTVGQSLGSLFPRLGLKKERFEVFAGVTSFTGPMNFANISSTGTERRGTGSSGFYEGFNKGTSLSFFGTDLAYQTGVRFTQTNLSGAGFNDETREQIFLSTGFFRRVDYGFQFGLVLDYLYEDWYYRGDLIQARGELGWVRRNSHIFGLKFAVGVDDDSARTSVKDDSGNVLGNSIRFEATDQYRLFYRKNLSRCGTLEGFAGWTERKDGLLGIDLDLPINGNLLWNTSATYLIPDEGARNGGNIEEGWNLAIGFTYRPCGFGAASRYSRPLQRVADNGTFMVDRK